MTSSFGVPEDDGCPLVTKIFPLTHCSWCKHVNSLADQYRTRGVDV